MKISIFENATLIGEATVFALDPPMCVAMAKFAPAPAYDAERHANVINADYVGDRSGILRLELPDGKAMIAEAISIQDFPEIDERQVDLIGIFEPSFDELFSQHPSFKDYWDSR
ncbi:hypothetical protein [Erythrobacter aureus]|uniref:hypothetical protein n=1 Tax=Erythrobacter aureus TaxID=2182384 RepID=UPI003A8E747B